MGFMRAHAELTVGTGQEKTSGVFEDDWTKMDQALRSNSGKGAPGGTRRCEPPIFQEGGKDKRPRRVDRPLDVMNKYIPKKENSLHHEVGSLCLLLNKHEERRVGKEINVRKDQATSSKGPNWEKKAVLNKRYLNGNCVSFKFRGRRTKKEGENERAS